MAQGVERAKDGGAIDEIVVTAQRRQQNVQDVPIAITAVSGAALRESGVRDPRDLTMLVPSLSMQAGTAASTTSLFIRGVGIGDFNSNTTGAVGIYVDDVFIGANAGKLFNVFDSDGIEVLKGPQGTLYGRNTTAGAIRFNSRKPTDTLSGDFSALYGRFNEVRLEGGIGGPIAGDKLKARISGLYHRNDGTTFNRFTGHRVNNLDLWAARGIVDFTPSGDALIRITVHTGRNSGGARQFQHRGQGVDFFGNPAFLPDGTPTDGFGYADTDGDPYAGDYDVEGKERINVFGASLTGQFTLGNVQLTTITAYEQVNRATLEDTDASPNQVISSYSEDRPRQFSQELRLQSVGENTFNWIVGGFYFHDNLKTDSSFDLLRGLRDPSAPLGGFDPVNSLGLLRYPYTQKTDSYAVFGQGDYKLTDSLTATLGLRYSHDRIRMKFESLFDALGTIVPVTAYSDVTVPLVSFDGRKSFNDLSWRAALNYKVDDTLVYASFSKGYNSGGFAGGASTDIAQLAPFRSEKLYAYEVGVKTDLLDRRLRFNASAFYYDYRDLQVFVFDLSGPVPVQRKLNAGNARIYGLEAEVTARPVRNLELFSAFTLMDSKYKTFTALGGASLAGNRLVNAPAFAASGGVRLTVPLANGSEVRANVDGTYTSPIFLYPDNATATKVKGYGLLNARLAWSAPGGRYDIAVFGKNLTKTRYITAIFPVITQDQVNYNEPRTYGVQLSAHF
ncbi:TonB-dependent receptor [Novosphingobium cyanobacteriorum]|uniref:TonB-dependent receptor n=1 Tax=Novosphingobium cyanobacteriorum TaxID=3024215 RepID=A0ABT6CKM7_9SPHN|nr:TonB-dependent receptor [Novosphingobium cyanobacteriorum]MDF8334351.1 TonB-dependent receptor [Novosphingobium cyanobacteriorum]